MYTDPILVTLLNSHKVVERCVEVSFHDCSSSGPPVSAIKVFFFFLFLSWFFILREGERERERERERASVAGEGQREREGERESQADSALSAQSRMQGSIPQTVRS